MCNTFVIYSDKVRTRIINWFLCFLSSFFRPSLSNAFFSSENVPRQRKRERKKGRGWEENMRRRCQREKRRHASSKTLAVCEWMASTIKVRSLEKCRSAKHRRSGATRAQICVVVKQDDLSIRNRDRLPAWILEYPAKFHASP